MTKHQIRVPFPSRRSHRSSMTLPYFYYAITSRRYVLTLGHRRRGYLEDVHVVSRILRRRRRV